MSHRFSSLADTFFYTFQFVPFCSLSFPIAKYVACQNATLNGLWLPSDATPVINLMAKAPKENYLKRHYNKFKAIWSSDQHRAESSAKIQKESRKGSKEKKNKCFGHFIMRIIHCCNGLSFCWTRDSVVLAISSPLTLPKGLLKKNAWRNHFAKII